MAISANAQCSWPNEQLFNLMRFAQAERGIYRGACHGLVTDRITGGEKSYTVFLGKCFDQLVFTEIGFVLGLNLVIEGVYELCWVLDSCSVHRAGIANQIVVKTTDSESRMNFWEIAQVLSWLRHL